MKEGVLVVLIAAATLVPAAAATSSRRVPLVLVPLPKALLGKVARPLALARDSGTVSNADEASRSLGSLTGGQLDSLGRITGYQLDYGTPFGHGAGVHQIQTGIEGYRTRADAVQGLALWRKQATKTRSLSASGLSVSLKSVPLAAAGGPHWAYLGTVRVQGLDSIYGLDAQIRAGRYLLDVSVSAGSARAARRFVPKLVRELRHRLRLALAGRLHGKPVKLPPALQPGPPATGPKPDALVLTQGDLGSSTRIQHAGYSSPSSALDANAVSVYDLSATSAGPFAYLTQEVFVAGSKLEGEYYAAFLLAGFAAQLAPAQATPVDVAGVGDDARAELVQRGLGSETMVVLSRGAYVDFVVGVGVLHPLSTSDVQNLAQSMANRLDAGFAG